MNGQLPGPVPPSKATQVTRRVARNGADYVLGGGTISGALVTLWIYFHYTANNLPEPPSYVTQALSLLAMAGGGAAMAIWREWRRPEERRRNR